MPRRLTALCMLIGLVLPFTASAHGQLVAHPRCHSLVCIERSQAENYKHARYVCHHGAHYNKYWSCKAQVWLKHELDQTEAALHPVPQVSGDGAEFSCIHSHEGAWNANTGNGYYGGLQMDYGFMSTYGSEFLHRWGTADHWPVWAQVTAARRARDSGRGYTPWPNTARACGLL